jgi:hypothetical protein
VEEKSFKIDVKKVGRFMNKVYHWVGFVVVMMAMLFVLYNIVAALLFSVEFIINFTCNLVLYDWETLLSALIP